MTKNPEQTDDHNTVEQDTTKEIGKKANTLVSLIDGVEKGPNYFHEYTMDDFSDFYPAKDLAYDKNVVRNMRAEALDAYYRIAKKDSGGLDETVSKMDAAEKSYENRPAKKLEQILKLGIAQGGILNPGRQRPYEIISLNSAEDADDYRNRIDAPFQLKFLSNPNETIFVGFDATLENNDEAIMDKLTRSSNVSIRQGSENRLPFGFSTLRYAYDPITGERFSVDNVLRYTIAIDSKTLKNAEEKVADGIEGWLDYSKSLDYDRLSFMVLSEIHEQSRLFKAMNQANSLINKKALQTIIKFDSDIWKSLKMVTFDLVKRDDFFAELREDREKIVALQQDLKDLPPAERTELISEINKLHAKIYQTIAKCYRAGNVDEHNRIGSQYTTIWYRTHDLINAEKSGKLDQYKIPQARNVGITREQL